MSIYAAVKREPWPTEFGQWMAKVLVPLSPALMGEDEDDDGADLVLADAPKSRAPNAGAALALA